MNLARKEGLVSSEELHSSQNDSKSMLGFAVILHIVEDDCCCFGQVGRVELGLAETEIWRG
jgi:hypothetical protein